MQIDSSFNGRNLSITTHRTHQVPVPHEIKETGAPPQGDAISLAILPQNNQNTYELFVEVYGRGRKALRTLCWFDEMHRRIVVLFARLAKQKQSVQQSKKVTQAKQGLNDLRAGLVTVYVKGGRTADAAATLLYRLGGLHAEEPPSAFHEHEQHAILRAVVLARSTLPALPANGDRRSLVA